MPVNIHGKEYHTVAERVNKFLDEMDGYGYIITELISADENRVVMKAEVGIGADVKTANGLDLKTIKATGYAEEVRGSTNINKTSALENCETSAVGRALAFAGYAGTEIASAEEVANAIGQQQASEATEMQAYEGDPRAFMPHIGKYKGEKDVGWIVDNDQKYVSWALEKLPANNPLRIAIERAMP